MHTTPQKTVSSINSTLHTEPLTSPQSFGTPSKRFNRSHHKSRSKSKEDSLDKSTPQFYVKNVCT